MLKKTSIILITLLAVVNIASAGYIDAKNIPEKKRTKAGLYLDSKDTFDLLQKEGSKALFVDVRTRSEVAWLGMPDIADANIPVKFIDNKYQWNEKRKNFKLKLNPDFVSSVTARLQRKGLSKDDKVLVICRSGKRSAKAADALTDAGFKQVISVIDGFDGDKTTSGVQKGKRAINGWKNSNLPWSYELDKNKMYFSDKSKDKDSKHKQMMKKMDVDKNGTVTKDEVDKHYKKIFSKLNNNKNGTLDKKEI